MMKPKVCIIGAEGWGSALSTAVCQNVIDGGFDTRVNIYVFDELVGCNYLSEVMNAQHENIKYLPGIELASNLIAVNDLIEAALDADILIFATSQDFIKSYCNKLAGKVKRTAYAVSLLKGLDQIGDGEFALYSHTIASQLQIPCYSLMCANSAMEMAQGKLCEITIGCDNAAHAQALVTLLETDNCKVFSIDDVDGVELCNTLKDLVALCAGFIDGLRLGDNARVTCLHLGLKEMMRFIKTFNPSTKLCTFFDSCGIANSIASSYGDKNVTFAKNFVTMQKTVQEIEMNLQNGRQLLGPVIADKVFNFLEKKQLQDEYPLFTIIHRICQNEVPPEELIETLRTHPDLSNYSITELQKQEYDMMPFSYSNIFLENVVDTDPESITEDVKEARAKYENEYTADEYSSSFKTRRLNKQLPANPNLGFSFEIASTDSKPEIYNKLKEASMMPHGSESKSPFEANRILSDFTSKMRLEDAKNSGQLIVMSNDEKDFKLGITKDSSLISLTKLIEQHVKPFNDQFKSIKVRVKVKAERDQQNASNMLPFKKDGTQSHNLTVRKAGAKPSDEQFSEDDKYKLDENRQESTTSESKEDQSDVELTLSKKKLTDWEYKLDDESSTAQSKKHQTDDVKNELDEKKRKSTSSDSKKDQSDMEFKNMIGRDLTMSKKKEVDWKYALDDESSTSKSKKHQTDDVKNELDENRLKSSSSESKKDQSDMQFKNKIGQHLYMSKEEESDGKYTLDHESAKKHQSDDIENKVEEVSEESSSSKSKKDETDEMENKLDEESQELKARLKKRQMEEMEFLTGKNEDDFEITPFDRNVKACAINSERFTVYVVGEKRLSRKDFMDKFIHKHEKRIEKVPLQFSSTNNSFYPSNQYVINRYEYPEQNKMELKNTPQKRHYDSQWRDGNIKDHSKVNPSTNTSSEQKDSTGLNKKSMRPLKKALSENVVMNLKGNESNSNSETTTDKTPMSQNSENIETCSENKETTNFKDSTGINNVPSTDMKNLRRSYEQPAEEALYDELVNNQMGIESSSNTDATTSETTSSEKSLEKSHSKSSADQLLQFDSSRKDNIGDDNLYNNDPQASVNDDNNDNQANKLAGGLKTENIDDKLFSIESAEYEKYRQSIEDAKYETISADDKSVEPTIEDKPAYTKIEEKINGEKISYFVDANHRIEKSQNSNQITSDANKNDDTFDEFQKDKHSEEKRIPEAIDRIHQEIEKERNQEIGYRDNDKWNDRSTTYRGRKENDFDKINEEIQKQKIEQMDDIAMIKDIRHSSDQGTEKKDQSVYLDKNESATCPVCPEWAWLFSNDKFDVQKSKPVEKVEDVKSEELSDKERYLGENIKDIKEKTEYQEVFEKNLNTKADNLPHSKDPASKDPLDISFLDKLTRKLKSHRRRKEKEAVDYVGDDPYKKSLAARYHLQETKAEDQKQRKGPSRPDAYPPINPRMPIPRPPFDVREQEYHTSCYRPLPDLRPRLLPRRRLQVSIQTRQASGACSHVTKLPTPLFKLPQSVMRSSALAIELGLLAGLLTRYKRGCK